MKQFYSPLKFLGVEIATYIHAVTSKRFGSHFDLER
jgi:hypothetical protein